MSNLKITLPGEAKIFLQNKKKLLLGQTQQNQYTTFVVHFYTWLNSWNGQLNDLSAKEINKFCLWMAAKDHTLITRHRFLCQLSVYLKWLEHKGHLRVSAKELHPSITKTQNNKNVQLPEVAEDFLKFLTTHLARGTCSSYRCSLNHLYFFTESKKIDLDSITRPQTELFFRYLLEDWNIRAKTRNRIILQIRTYLRWLYERGKLVNHPNELIRISDLPIIPKILPRALDPQTDLEIQKRLKSSDVLACQGLLLMRRTGIRIGELRNLTVDCVNEDLNGHFYLKVPLGKLQTERLVPLDSETYALVQKLRLRQQNPNFKTKPQKFLMTHENGQRCSISSYSLFLKMAAKGLNVGNEPIVSHRLRHTYATSLMNGGLSMLALKELLGHKSFAMTLHYLKVTPESIRREYYSALERLSKQGQIGQQHNIVESLSVKELFQELISLLNKTSRQKNSKNLRVPLIIKRLKRIQDEVSVLE